MWGPIGKWGYLEDVNPTWAHKKHYGGKQVSQLSQAVNPWLSTRQCVEAFNLFPNIFSCSDRFDEEIRDYEQNFLIMAFC